MTDTIKEKQPPRIVTTAETLRRLKIEAARKGVTLQKLTEQKLNPPKPEG